MKKKLFALVTAAMSIVFVFSFTACNDNGSNAGGGNTQHSHIWSQTWEKNETHH